MYIITDDEIDKLSESSKNDFYKILAELNPYTNLQYGCQQMCWRYCGSRYRWMYCDGICAKCDIYLNRTTTMPNIKTNHY